MTKYVAPSFSSDGFNCPHCDAYAHQNWFENTKYGKAGSYHLQDFMVSTCSRCKRDAYWLKGIMIYPISSTAPLPTEDMPEDVKDDFIEARDVVNRSPRAACALLRLSIQKLMVHLEEKGKDLNTDIGNLVKKGLAVKIQRALDSVRVIGNNAVHPGKIDLKDDDKTATTLFELLNIIVDVTISQSKKIDELYDGKIPKEAKEEIEKRDSGTKK